MQQLESALREVRGRVEQRRADINSQTSQGAVVKALMEARQRGEIDGIYGRLGEAGGRGGEGRNAGRERAVAGSAAVGGSAALRSIGFVRVMPSA